MDITNEDGAGYVGTIFMGSNDAPVKVLFDTGSDFLAITSDLCLDPKLGKQEEAKAVYDPVNQIFKNENKDLRKCKSTAYLSQKSTSAHKMGGDDEKLDYGSAKLMGKLYTDRPVLTPTRLLALTSSSLPFTKPLVSTTLTVFWDLLCIQISREET